MKATLKDAVHQQRIALAELLSVPLAQLAEQCATVWGQREELDIVMTDSFRDVPHYLFLYALDTNGIQISDKLNSSL